MHIWYFAVRIVSFWIDEGRGGFLFYIEWLVTETGYCLGLDFERYLLGMFLLFMTACIYDTAFLYITDTMKKIKNGSGLIHHVIDIYNMIASLYMKELQQLENELANIW